MENWRLNHLRGLLEEDPDDEFVIYALAQESIKLESWDNALEYFLKLKKLNANYVGLYYHLGGLYAELEEKENALKTYKEGIEVAKKLGDHHALSELMNAKTNLELGL